MSDEDIQAICHNCKYYEPPLTFGETGWGTCLRMAWPDCQFSALPKLYVDKTFGCIHWEEK